MIYTLSYTRYPQKKRGKIRIFYGNLNKQMFCEIIMKIAQTVKKSQNLLTLILWKY